MTDAAVPVTQSAVESFTAQYLRSLGCRVEIQDDEWGVMIPEDVETDLPKGELILLCDTVEDSDETHELLHAESSFFQSVLDDASERAPAGGIKIDATTTDIIVPDWLQESTASVSDIGFTPYYDRSALVVLFWVSVETVSEYQQEFLHSIGIDVRSTEILPNIDDTFLTLTQSKDVTVTSGGFTVEPEQAGHLVDASREPLLSDIQPQIDEIHQEASRAADAELEEYRQLQRQREEEFETKITGLRSKIEGLNESIENKNQTERVETLKERRECRSTLEEVESGLVELRRKREQGYPDQQREIRDRHGVEVVVSPVTITEVKYERGDAEFKIAENNSTTSLTIGYGRGVGVTEEVVCDTCSQPLTGENPLGKVSNGVMCALCSEL